MNEEIEVHCQPASDGWSCRVRVGSGAHVTLYQVSVSRVELATYAPGAAEPSELVATSFAYLLEREPRESILRRFAISEIERCFPDYPAAIVRRL
ncbi:MAG TPA: hypothetical protein VJK49_02375 [Candidatus Limnocylindrales bacterium]|nr:hypothetical protein [Candidatus Limnocylindrales bacterium]